VRTIAEVWTGLAKKNASAALLFADSWSSSQMKLNQRLALFAAADEAIPPNVAADVLLALPAQLLFHTNSTVEVIRLIKARWAGLPRKKRAIIEDRIATGAAPNSFRENADAGIDELVDRSRYDILGEMQRLGLELSANSKSLLDAIQTKHANWQLRPSEQAGFHIWRGGSFWIKGDSEKLQHVSDELLVDEAKEQRTKRALWMVMTGKRFAKVSPCVHCVV